MRSPSVLLVLAGPAVAAHAQLTAESHSAVYDHLSHTVQFSIRFSGLPDFYTVDPWGRERDAFQFHLHTLAQPGLSFQGNTIVRGSEIRFYNQVPFRNDMLPGNGEPGSGGWGPIAGMVPFVLQDRTITFTAPYSIVNTPSGVFTYDLRIVYYGATSYWSEGNPSIPAPCTALLMALGGLAAHRRRRAPACTLP